MLREYTYSIGFDDTDGYSGGCTTYVMYKFLERHPWLKLIDYPRLIRNNPNVPWKTRGNGSLSIHFQAQEKDALQAFENLISLIKEQARNEDQTNPGVILVKHPIPSGLHDFSIHALTSVIAITSAKRLIQENNLLFYATKNERGLIGALSAIGNPILPDYSFEVLAYRVPKNWGTPRKFNVEDLKRLEHQYPNDQFSSYDFTNQVALAFPHGPDPVYFGIRGNQPERLVQAIQASIHPLEEIHGSLLLRTNQGTEQHFWYAKETDRPFHVTKVKGTVQSNPRIQQGKHLFFQVKSSLSQKIFWVAVYEPTKELRVISERMLAGDLIHVFGGVRDPNETPYPSTPTINLEKLVILEAQPFIKKQAPKCETCGKTLTSAGKNKGYKCPRCHQKYPKKQPLIIKESRAKLQGIYLPSLNAQRHLTKPLHRYGTEHHELSIPKITVHPLNPLSIR